MPSEPVALVLAKLSDHRQGGNGWIARCPAHDDRKPSLSINEGDDGRALITCHAGCTCSDIVSALGLQKSDLFPPKPNGGRNGHSKPSPAAASKEIFPTARAAVASLEKKHGPRSECWTYHDKSGAPVGVVVRWDPPGADKFYRPVNRNGQRWVCAGMRPPRPLYNLHKLADASQIIVVEGEKTADALESIGFTATTSAHGSMSAAQTDWAPLAGKQIPIMPDANDAGTKYKNNVIDILAKLVPEPSIRVAELPELPPGGDAHDFITARRGAGADDSKIVAEITALIDQAERINTDQYGPVVVCLADVTPEPIKWLWPGRIPLGKLTLLAGDPGLGKSLVSLDLAARVSTGTPWPDAVTESQSAGGVVLLTAEDDLADTVRPRLDAAGANADRITALQAVRRRDTETGRELQIPFCLTSDLDDLEAAVARCPGCRLIIIDPITAYLGGTDSHKNSEVRGVLAPLADMASRHHVAIVAVTHLNKSHAGPAIYRSMGSLAFTAAARAVWGITKDKEDAARRLVLPVKVNLAADVLGMAYGIHNRGATACLAWEPDPVSVTADEALGSERSGDDSEKSSLEEAVDWLSEQLADGPKNGKEIKDKARSDGIKGRTLDRAKKKLNVQAGPDGFKGSWVWRLPDSHIAPKNTQCASPREWRTVSNVAQCAEDWGQI